MIPHRKPLLPASLLVVFSIAGVANCQQTEPAIQPAVIADLTGDELPLVFETDFENGIADWELMDEDWKIAVRDGSQVFSQFSKASNYKPTVRSPFHQALLRDKNVSSFQLDVRVLSTHLDYNHRDACLFFGYQSPTQFYYVHLGKKMDPHANQIFIVNNADRTKISLTTTDGTDWDDQWHHVRIKRNTETGLIEVFYDDLEKPVMTANDKTFTAGRIGLGSFDDTADWDDLKLTGVVKD